MQNTSGLSIEQKIASGGMLHLRTEAAPWLGICPVSAYKLVKEGKLKVTKIGRRSLVAAPDAIACRDRLRAVLAA